MSLLAALVRAYDRLPDAPPHGYSPEKIGFCIVLNLDGSVAEIEDLRRLDKKRSPRLLLVPQAARRTVAIVPNFLWDKSAYTLGVTAQASRRTFFEHAAFRDQHMDWLADTQDDGLRALRQFLQAWKPKGVKLPVRKDRLHDQNIVFRLARESLYLHERPEARALWQRIRAEGAADPQLCLVTGLQGPTARLHPSIKGVWGVQSSGASLISFNLDASTSYDHEQGDNAPISEAAAFAYATVLNRFLEKDSHHRVQIGDVSLVFWAEADPKLARVAEDLMGAFFDPTARDGPPVSLPAGKLAAIRAGSRLEDVAPDLDTMPVHILGLSPNAGRLSVRFHWQGRFGILTHRYQRFLAETELQPPPPDGWPPLWRYLLELAAQGGRETIPARVAGDWMQALFTGSAYPFTLLSTLILRIRTDHTVNAWRVALLRSLLMRNFGRTDVPVSFDPNYTHSTGYLLGRMLAVYEDLQRAAYGGTPATTLCDKYYKIASTSPRRVFPTLASVAQHHIVTLRRKRPDRLAYFEQELGGIRAQIPLAEAALPSFLPIGEQAFFALGYYHQRNEFFPKRAEQSDARDPEITP